MPETSPQYLLIINRAAMDLVRDWKLVTSLPDYENLTPIVITAKPELTHADDPTLKTITCNFASGESIHAALAPYQNAIRGVFCKGETNIQYLRRVIPFLPKDVRVASPESLERATNKHAMRAAFAAKYPGITPKFLEVSDDSVTTIARIEAEVPYPVIVKPSGLASSLLIQSCQTRPELQAALRKVFSSIHAIYRDQNRTSQPIVLVEEFLEGPLYSTDAYVMEPGHVVTCPPVAYIANKQRGIDDFSLYKRWLPAGLNTKQEHAQARIAAQAIDAIGLTYSSVHIEMVLTKDGWKIIELGPRIGRYRHRMYEHGFGINHYVNDVRIHLGEEPIVANKLQNYCSAYSIYPEKEGTLRELAGLDFLQHDPTVHHLGVHAQPGDTCKYAKHGGKLTAEFYIVSPDKNTFDQKTAYVESHVKAITY